MADNIIDWHIDHAGPKDHSECAAFCKWFIREEMDTDVTVSTAPPIVHGPYTGNDFTCAHGVRFYLEPTGEQIAQWVRDDIE